MSLLLDARKKAQSAQRGDAGLSGRELSLEQPPDTESSNPDLSQFDNARSAGQNLFNAKSPARAGINRNLLIALGGTLLFLAAGAGYVWYAIQPTHPVIAATPQKPAPTTPQNDLVPKIASAQAVSPQGVLQSSSGTVPAHTSRSAAKASSPRARTMHIERQAEPIDPLLNSAYLAYRSGKFEQAQQLYRQALNLDARNIDALLGLAVIAQHRGSDNEAAHYYAQALALDPRDAVANAGMSALTSDDNRESRLKNLLNEQQNSSSLHFALGNYYAGQARWGEAQQSYSNAYQLEPENAELAFNLAVNLDRLGQKKPAAQYYQRALKLDQSHSAGFDHAQIEQRVQELAR